MKAQSTALAVLPKEFQADFLEEKFIEVESQVKPELLDVNDEEGRKRIKELALKINKSKDALDKPMRDYLRNLKALPKALELNARESKQRFEKLRESVIEPLNEARKYQDDLLDWLNGIPAVCSDPGATSEQIQGWLNETNNIDQSQIWPELQKKFKVAIEAATTTATVTLERVEQQEKQAAELELLRKQQFEAEQKERERVIAEAAAENARLEAKAQATAEREAIERRAVESKQREEKAIADAEQAERNEELARQEHLKAIEENKQREAQAVIDNEIAAKKQAEQAIENERVRLAEVAEQEKQEAINRENDKKHRSAINRRALTEMIAGGVDPDEAKKAIILIAQKKIGDIKIFY